MEPSSRDNASDAFRKAAWRRRRWRVEAGLIFAFWTVLALLTLGNAFLSPRGGAFDWNAAVALRTFARFYLWALVTPLVFWLARRYPLDESSGKGRGLRNAVLHAAVAFFGAAVLDLADDVVRYGLNPERTIADLRVFNDVLDLSILYELAIALAVLAAGFARSYFLRLRRRDRREARLEARADRLQRQLTEARLQALRMQLNPHFLFNTLHAVSTLVGDDPAGVRRMIARLSELLRHVLEEGDRDEVPLREEMHFLGAYLDIMQIRFQGRLEVDLTGVPPETEDALVPPLLLQPLVENAVKHGAGEVEGTGRVSVRARRVENERPGAERLLLAVGDNGPRFAEGDTPDIPDGTGLENVRARLRELHGADAALSFRTAEGGGLVAEVSLPFRPAAPDAELHTKVRPQPVT